MRQRRQSAREYAKCIRVDLFGQAFRQTRGAIDADLSRNRRAGQAESPVTITVRTPISRRAAIRQSESSRGGSRRSRTRPSRYEVRRRPSAVFVAGSKGTNRSSRSEGPAEPQQPVWPRRQYALAIEVAHSLDVDDLQRIARQRAGFIGTQDIHGGGFVRGGKPCQQPPRLASNCAPNAADKVKVAGSAAGIVASKAVRLRRIKSAGGSAIR